jgi:hypothetical protein
MTVALQKKMENCVSLQVREAVQQKEFLCWKSRDLCTDGIMGAIQWPLNGIQDSILRNNWGLLKIYSTTV